MEIWLRPSCFSRNSASDEISVIDIKKMADRAMEAKLDFDENKLRCLTSEFLYISVLEIVVGHRPKLIFV